MVVWTTLNMKKNEKGLKTSPQKKEKKTPCNGGADVVGVVLLFNKFESNDKNFECCKYC